MTQDILMSTEESVAPVNDSAHKQLQQFCLLAKTAHGAAILELIKQVLEAPGVYVFGELLVMPNVQDVSCKFISVIYFFLHLTFFPIFKLKTGDHIKYFNTLNLFAYGTYKQFRQQPQDYLDLTPAMQKKLQHLTIVALAIKNKCIPYEVLLEELEINNVRHLEDVIIEAIYAGKSRAFFILQLKC